MRGAVEVGLATAPTGSRVLDPVAEATPLRPAAGRHRGYLLCRKHVATPESTEASMEGDEGCRSRVDIGEEELTSSPHAALNLSLPSD